MFSEILVPTDGSDLVEPAIEAAIDLANQYDARLHVLYNVDSPAANAGIGSGFISEDSLLDSLEAEGEKITQEISNRADRQGVTTVSAVRRGNPREGILDYADENGIDLIVMGTHGRTGVKRALIGSVTESVVRHATIPVLTVHEAPTQ